MSGLAEKPAPRFAVLLCTHNGERFLRGQLDSLIAQSLAPHQVFIHDWGSIDRTLDVIESRRAHWPASCRVDVVRHDSAPGACRSFLGALRHVLASHDDFDYLLFCDQDDVWDPRKLAVFAQRVRTEPDLDLLYCDVDLVDAQGATLAPSYLGPGGAFGRPMDFSHPSALFVSTVTGMSMAASRRLLLRTLPAWSLDDWVMHDWAVAIQAHLLGVKAAFIAESLVHYRQHDANVLGGMQSARAGSAVSTLLRARSYVRAVQRQYRACVELAERLNAPCRPNPRIGRVGVAWTVFRSRSLPPLLALKVAAGYLAFWA